MVYVFVNMNALCTVRRYTSFFTNVCVIYTWHWQRDSSNPVSRFTFSIKFKHNLLLRYFEQIFTLNHFTYYYIPIYPLVVCPLYNLIKIRGLLYFFSLAVHKHLTTFSSESCDVAFHLSLQDS